MDQQKVQAYLNARLTIKRGRQVNEKAKELRDKEKPLKGEGNA